MDGISDSPTRTPLGGLNGNLLLHTVTVTPDPNMQQKKRNRSDKSKARERDISSKKHKTYKACEQLIESKWMANFDDGEGLQSDLKKMASMRENFDKVVKDAKEQVVSKYTELFDKAIDKAADMSMRYEAKSKLTDELHKKWIWDQKKVTDAELASAKAELKAAKAEIRAANTQTQALQSTLEYQKAINETRGITQKYGELYGEVLQLRKLKYKLDRSTKGQIGAVYYCATCDSQIHVK